MRKVFLASTIALLGVASTAEAHFNLVSPPQISNDTGGGKGNPPCGPDTGTAATPTQVQGGHSIMLKVNETVPHLGFYRVALAINSRSELPLDNVVYDSKGKVLPPSGNPSGTSDHADVENPAVFPVLADNLFATDPHAGPATYMASVMIPNLSCDHCILQVIEFMHPHGFNTSTPGPGGGYFYHHCAELKITADPGMPPFVAPGADGGAPDASSGDARTDADMGGAGGSSGGAGQSGSAGNGTGGASGAGGSAASGTAGSTGAAGSTAGSGSEGTAGTGGGAGAVGASGTPSGAGSAGSGAGRGARESGGGCAFAEHGASSTIGLVLLGLALSFARRKNRSRS